MRVDGIILDFGNTLFPWNEEQARALFEGIEPLYREAFGPQPDWAARAKRVSERLQEERDATTLREVRPEDFTEAMYPGRTVDGVEELFHDTFVSLCRLPEGMRETLEELGRHRPLAVLSNFGIASPVHAVLEREGLRDLFRHVEVSATRGFRKPHPEPFEVTREALGTAMEHTLMVGDNFFADIVGGHRAGLLTALTRQFTDGPDSDPRAPEVQADWTVHHLSELPS